MKDTLIEQLHQPQVKELTFNLFETIEVTYGIREADDRFIDYFVNVLVKNYGYLNFEQIEDAFFRNSTGLLDNFLPKVGFRTDNKVLKFNIQDLTKIINAFCKYLGIEKNDITLEKKEFTEEEKTEIHLKWINALLESFDTYKKDKVHKGFGIPLYTSKYLAKLGLIDENEINLNEPEININIGRKSNKRKDLSNERLVYKCFDNIIEAKKHLKEFIKDVGAMPY